MKNGKNEELVYLEILDARGVLFGEKRKEKLYTYTMGYEGEREFLEWSQRYLHSNWRIENDFWFLDGKAMQADFILMSAYIWNLIEVKNYYGHFTYKDGLCWHNNKLIDDDIFDVMKQRINRIGKIAVAVDHRIEVRPVFVFINQHGQLHMHQKPPFEVLQRNQLVEFLEGLGYVEPMTANLSNRITQQLDRNRIAYGINYTRLDPTVLTQMRKGIYCANCKSFEVNINKPGIQCRQCGTKESIESVICRHAKELSIIVHNLPEMLNSKNLNFLMANQLSLRTTRKYLSKNFEKEGKSRKTYYKIK
ncbi:NERD domain-containing protein [Fundicoccus culcitae]|uniref:NERD domain-containing protein n=1 Tax=Fundicoccus culcitae TaxID=2969821 RepID=A0ABY5P4C9_9LACT|nr:NERD domain-containing protein [Fundicoccus culcitae]UUX33561.1 NERD domain-containing protein [Fundicoccus culcitae]